MLDVSADTPTETGHLSEVQKKRIDALLKEYDRVTGEMRSIQDTQRRMITLLPAVLAVGVPLLLRPASTIPNELVAWLFIGFGFLFMFLVTNYVGLTRGILRLSLFQMQHIAPQIDELLAMNGTCVLGWEYFVRERVRQHPLELLGFALIHGAELLLLAGPSIVCLFIGLYLVYQTAIAWIVFPAVTIYALFAGLTCYFAWRTAVQARTIATAAPITRDAY